MLVYMIKGELPWSDIANQPLDQNSRDMIALRHSSIICEGMEPEVSQFVVFT